MNDLPAIARSLVVEGKGILAADESIHTADQRLMHYGIDATLETRRKYRDLFLSAPGMESYLSGVILFAETFIERDGQGSPFPSALSVRGVHPGIKVDEGTEPFPESPDESITKGLLGLSERLAEFKKGGAVFTKWRAVIRIDGDKLPTAAARVENAKRLAAYAKEAQMAGLVPILEPEVLLEGTHARSRAKAVLEETLGTLFTVLREQTVDPESMLLKTSMALSGSESGKKDMPEEVAEDTVAALMASVPSAVAGIVFLSGGQTPEQATDNLRAIAKKAKAANAPWPLTFSFARALQDEALSAWGGRAEYVEAARTTFLHRLKAVSEASQGK